MIVITIYNFNLKKKQEFKSECADHCATFSLSEKDICNHIHLRNCPQCNTLDLIFIEILKAIKDLFDADVQKELIHSLILHKNNMFEWKYHLIRNLDPRPNKI